MQSYREPIFHDRQTVLVSGPITTTSTTFVDIPGATLITGDLGSPANYQFWMSLSIQQSNNNTSISFRGVVDGVPGDSRTVDFGPGSGGEPQHATLVGQASSVGEGTLIEIQWLVSGGEGQINNLGLMIDGIPDIRIIPIASVGVDSYLLETGEDALLKEDGEFLLVE